MDSQAQQLMRDIEQADAEILLLQRAHAQQQRDLRHMQAPLLHLRAQGHGRVYARSMQAQEGAIAAAATAATAELFHAQLQLQHTPPALAGSAAASFATAHVCSASAASSFQAASASSASLAASSSPVVAAAASSTSPSLPSLATLHVLLSNQSSEIVDCSAACSSLVIHLRVAPFSSDGGGGFTQSSFLAPFPAARWGPRASFQAALPIDLQLLNQAHVQVRVALRLQRNAAAAADSPSATATTAAAAAAGFVEIPLREWTLDAFDVCVPVLSAPPSTAAAAIATSNKRKRESGEGDQAAAIPTKQHQHALGSINQQHQQALFAPHMGDERRLLQQPHVNLFGSLYSSPGWFAQHCRSLSPSVAAGSRSSAASSSSSLQLLLAPASFQIAFALPLLLEKSWTQALNPIIQCFVCMILSHLLPAHSMAFSEATILHLLNSGSSSGGRSSGGGGGGASLRPLSATMRFTTRLPSHQQQLVEWSVDYKMTSTAAAAMASSSGSAAVAPPASILFLLRVRAPSASLLPSLRASLLHRLHKLLFRSSSPPSGFLPRGWSGVSARRLPGLVAFSAAASASGLVGGSSSTHATITPASQQLAANEAHKWKMAYLKAAAEESGGVGATAAAASASASSRSLPSPPLLLQHVQLLSTNLDDMRQQLQQYANNMQQQQQPQQLPQTKRLLASTALRLLQLFLSTRMPPPPLDPTADLSHASSCFGSLRTLLC